jgi:hypothetical protein
MIEEVLIFRLFVGELREVEKEIGNAGGMVVEGDLDELSELGYYEKSCCCLFVLCKL